MGMARVRQGAGKVRQMGKVGKWQGGGWAAGQPGQGGVGMAARVAGVGQHMGKGQGAWARAIRHNTVGRQLGTRQLTISCKVREVRYTGQPRWCGNTW